MNGRSRTRWLQPPTVCVPSAALVSDADGGNVLLKVEA